MIKDQLKRKSQENNKKSNKIRMATKNEGSVSKTSVGIGVGVTAALLSAAGAYFLYGSKDAAKNRKSVKSWMLKAKAEVLDGIETAKDMTKEDYEKLVDTSVKTYSKLKSASAEEVIQLAKELKSHWKELEKKGEVKKDAMVKTVAKVAPKKALPKPSTKGGKEVKK